MASDTPPKRKPGRPKKVQGSKVPYDLVDQLLVEGELVSGPGGKEVRVWPSQRDIAKRYDVSTGLIGMFAKQQNTSARRVAFMHGLKLPPRTLADGPGPASGEAHAPETTALEQQSEEEQTRRPGRPRKAQAPLISLEELDRMLVFGEVLQTDDGAATTVYPSYKQLAERYGVSQSYISSYAKTHNCARRKEAAKTRLALRVEDKLLEKRAEAIAVGKDDVVRLIDEFLLGFEKALKEGRVRQDNPTDVNTFVRLKEFIMGGADSRQELHAALSLESIQQRYARLLRTERESPELTGMDEAPRQKPNEKLSANISPGRSVSDLAIPPPPPIHESAEKLLDDELDEDDANE